MKTTGRLPLGLPGHNVRSPSLWSVHDSGVLRTVLYFFRRVGFNL